MTPGAFLRKVWPATGLYCLAYPSPKDGIGYWTKVEDNLADAVSAAYGLIPNHNLFFNVFTLKQRKIVYTDNGVEKTRVRTQANAHEARVLMLDLDVGAGDPKKYQSIEVAREAVLSFAFRIGLHQPLLVCSGGGVHAYWLLETAVEAGPWLEMAARLRALADLHGVRYDPTRTTDTASLLRVCGSVNTKPGRDPLPVYLLNDASAAPVDVVADQLVQAAASAKLAVAVPAVAKLRLDANGLPTQHKPQSYSPESFGDVLKACAQMREVVRAHYEPAHPHFGKLDNNAWYRAVVGVVGHCKDGEQIARELTALHPRSSADIDAKLAQALNMQPTSCAVLQENLPWGADLCTTCPMRSSAKNPHMAARLSVGKSIEQVLANQAAKATKPAPPPPPPPAPGSPPPPPPPPPPDSAADEEHLPPPPPIIDPPAGYQMTLDGTTVEVEWDEDGEMHSSVVMPFLLYPIQLRCNPDRSGHVADWVCVQQHNDGHNIHSLPFAMPLTNLVDERKFRDALMDRGVNPGFDLWRQTMRFASAYSARLQQHAATDVLRESLGWQDRNTHFVMPEVTYTVSGRDRRSNVTMNDTMRAVSVMGDPKLERQALQFYEGRSDSTLHQATICASLGSILMQFTSQHGLIMSLVGESGVAKSTIMFVAASLWGDHKSYVLNGTAGGATKNYVGNRIAVFSNLPTMIDEVTHMAQEEANTLAMRSSQVSGRGRLNSDGTEKRQVGGDRSSIIITTSNRSIFDMLGSNNAARTAGHMRVVEIEMKQPPANRPTEARQMMKLLSDNHGHTGRAFARYVTEHRAAVELRVEAAMARVEKELATDPSERFRVAWLAVVMVAAEIARDLDLFQADVEAIYTWATTQVFADLRAAVAESVTPPGVVVTDLMLLCNGRLAITDTRNGAVTPIDTPMREILGRYDRTLQRIYLSRSALSESLRRSHHTILALERSLEPIPGLMLNRSIIVPVPTTAGVTVRVSCIELDATHPEITASGKWPALTVVEGGATATKQV